MTAYRFVTLTCDGCGEVYEGGQDRTAREARDGARREGWAHAVFRNPGGSSDYCPRCRTRNQQSRCPRCGGLDGVHGLVHVRHGNGGGHNEPCPNQQAEESR